jgi:hypothetical protein
MLTEERDALALLMIAAIVGYAYQYVMASI